MPIVIHGDGTQTKRKKANLFLLTHEFAFFLFAIWSRCWRKRSAKLSDSFLPALFSHFLLGFRSFHFSCCSNAKSLCKSLFLFISTATFFSTVNIIAVDFLSAQNASQLSWDVSSVPFHRRNRQSSWCCWLINVRKQYKTTKNLN